jgi:hypothetical protein
MYSKARPLAILCAAIAASIGPRRGAGPAPLRALDAAAFADLKATPAPDPAGGSEDWVIRWTTKAASASQQDAFAVIDRRDLAVAVVRERDPQLAADRLVVIAVDAAGATISTGESWRTRRSCAPRSPMRPDSSRAAR